MVRNWLNANPREVAIVHFGSVNNFDEAMVHVKEELDKIFQDKSSVQLNTEFQATGEWPTLQEAIDSNQRLFLMIRFKDLSKLTSSEKFISVVKVGKKQLDMPKPDLPKGTLSILSMYGSGDVGDDCEDVIDDAHKYCGRVDADWTKVATYGSSGAASCLTSRARVCNARIQEILNACKSHKPSGIDIVFTDYPNYLGKATKTIVEIAEEENLKRT